MSKTASTSQTPKTCAPARGQRGRDDNRWLAVVTRDESADGSFVYAVATTGVYCRPSCPSKQARRENVSFHATPVAAERCGFRACKRCDPKGVGRNARAARIITAACRAIENAEEPVKLATLAKAANLSRFHFHRLFKSVTGVTPKAYALAHRHGRVRAKLASAGTVTEAIHDAGYSSNAQFYATSEKVIGMTPSNYRKGGKSEVITFAVGTCSLGAILVAASAKGVVAILLGDDPDAVLRDLQDRFPEADLVGGDADFEKRARRVIAYAENPAQRFELPLDVRGTAFQQRVWQALRDIPCGQTASYSGVAKIIGEPGAVRAVARACGANPAAIAIPCHRVVRTDGALSGYRWGIERKRALLERESTEASRVRHAKSKKRTAP